MVVLLRRVIGSLQKRLGGGEAGKKKESIAGFGREKDKILVNPRSGVKGNSEEGGGEKRSLVKFARRKVKPGSRHRSYSTSERGECK